MTLAAEFDLIPHAFWTTGRLRTRRFALFMLISSAAWPAQLEPQLGPSHSAPAACTERTKQSGA
jgi:hypothetical protein